MEHMNRQATQLRVDFPGQGKGVFQALTAGVGYRPAGNAHLIAEIRGLLGGLLRKGLEPLFLIAPNGENAGQFPNAPDAFFRIGTFHEIISREKIAVHPLFPCVRQYGVQCRQIAVDVGNDCVFHALFPFVFSL